MLISRKGWVTILSAGYKVCTGSGSGWGGVLDLVGVVVSDGGFGRRVGV